MFNYETNFFWRFHFNSSNNAYSNAIVNQNSIFKNTNNNCSGGTVNSSSTLNVPLLTIGEGKSNNSSILANVSTNTSSGTILSTSKSSTLLSSSSNLSTSLSSSLSLSSSSSSSSSLISSSSTLLSSNYEESSSPPPQKKIKRDAKQMVDVCVGTSVGTITEPDCLGPCEPGTSVTLEGIVWHETESGVLVVNVTWRGKTYVGTLLDCTRHDWAPPRYDFTNLLHYA